jgi:hypothetical protein
MQTIVLNLSPISKISKKYFLKNKNKNKKTPLPSLDNQNRPVNRSPDSDSNFSKLRTGVLRFQFPTLAKN